MCVRLRVNARINTSGCMRACAWAHVHACVCVFVRAHVCEMMAECNTYYSGNTTIGDKHMSLLELCAAASTSYLEPKKRVVSIPPPVTCSSNPVMR